MCPHLPNDSAGATQRDDSSSPDLRRWRLTPTVQATWVRPVRRSRPSIRAGTPRPPSASPRTARSMLPRPDRATPVTYRRAGRPVARRGGADRPGYDLLEPLGEGGMGVVWKARQTKLNRLVALKMVLGEQRAGSKELIRFLAEAEAVAAVKHPHVVQVYEYGEASGRPFLAMEYLPGGSLADRLKQTGRLDPKAAAELVATLAAAVQAAHDLGIVHRDLKPGNVLYDEHGEPKVTDFGLAKRAGGSDLTATQAVMGTPAYMAPEQARGDTKFVGPQADVYSLGVILYECLTGTRPFEAAGPARAPAEGGRGRARAAREASRRGCPATWS